MRYTEKLKEKLLQLEEEVNSNKPFKIQFHQQVKVKKHMSFTGGNGRLRIAPASDAYDISLDGKSIEKQMYGFMKNLCGRNCDGYKQKNQNLGKEDNPYWRVRDFNVVRKAVFEYAKTKR